MLKKKYIKSRNVCKVTFELPAAEIPDNIEVAHVHLVGDFNDWDTSETAMKRNNLNWSRVLPISSAIWSMVNIGLMTGKPMAMFPASLAWTIVL